LQLIIKACTIISYIPQIYQKSDQNCQPNGYPSTPSCQPAKRISINSKLPASQTDIHQLQAASQLNGYPPTPSCQPLKRISGQLQVADRPNATRSPTAQTDGCPTNSKPATRKYNAMADQTQRGRRPYQQPNQYFNHSIKENQGGRK